MDLTGFWEMIYIQVLDSNTGPSELKVSGLALKMQVEDVDAKFVKLSKVEDDGWVDKEVKVVKKVQKKKVLPGQCHNILDRITNDS